MSGNEIRMTMNERGVAGLYLLMHCRGDASGFAQDALSELLRYMYLEGIKVGMQNPTADATALEGELDTVWERLKAATEAARGSGA